jgi:lipoprotein-releasing system ATP-binding protein
MIIGKNITKSYGNLQVLKGVDIEVKTSEVVSIVGASGAGKTTLLQILGTLDRADSGQVLIDGVDVLKLSESKLAEFRNHNIGFIFQFHHLLPEFTAIENVCLPGFIAKKDSKKVKDKATELLAFLGLKDRIHHKPSELSGGEQQRVAVARALINDPKVIYADEPSGNLDSKTSKELHELFFKLRDEFQQTFVIITHNQDLAEMADRMLIMSDGVVKEEKLKLV